MKLYRYYKIPMEDNSSIYDDLTVDEKYPLYAFTTDKQFDKQFIHERDMKKFIRFVSHVDEEAYVKFANSHTNNKLEFIPYSRCRKKRKCTLNDVSNEERFKDTLVLSTRYEKDIVEDYTENCEHIFEGSVYDDNIIFFFKEKYVKALKNLNYYNMLKVMMYACESRYTIPEKYSEYMEYDMDPFYIDEFELFITLYGDTFV